MRLRVHEGLQWSLLSGRGIVGIRRRFVEGCRSFGQENQSPGAGRAQRLAEGAFRAREPVFRRRRNARLCPILGPMNREQVRPADTGVRARQAPLRAIYRSDPAQAVVTDLAWTCGEGDLASPMLGRVHFGSQVAAQVDYGVHHAIGGTHSAPVPGDLLCAALASCQESSLRMVADALGVRLVQLGVSVRGHVDVRGTLGDLLAPVAFQSFEVSVRLRAAPATHPQRLRQLYRAAERSCVVLQTLRSGVPVSVELDAPVTEPTFIKEKLHDSSNQSRL